VLALAYNNQAAKAYQVLLSTGLRKNDAAFWYDAARVCSLARDVRQALLCLQKAVQAGFKDQEAARVIPDLEFVRKRASDQFDKALEGSLKIR
jgi:hypothetical protein